ncbi:MAG: CBS domain-containing protein [Deltaproteobacteria bacterium]|nr:MAG: CBS domain-containing protein [Deltaproteobacteria bacterium]TNF27866.1 MAG: CBS domain-containing protein [Deltaproteobacteria bacterium]
MKRVQVPVSEFTSEELELVDVNTSIIEVYKMMKDKGIRHLPVVDGDKAVGIISDRDVRFCSHMDGAAYLTAREIMTPDPIAVSMHSPLGRVAYEMSNRKLGSVLVFDDKGALYGIFTTTDALNALVEIFSETFPLDLDSKEESIFL